MKVALLFCGRIKSFEECYSSIKLNFLDLLKDCTYDSFLSHNSNNKSDDLKSFNELYNVKEYESIPVDKCIDLSKYDDVPLHSWKDSNKKSIYMYYNLKRAYEMMENYAKSNSIKYDIIIYMRADMVFRKPYSLPDSIKENTVYSPSEWKWTGVNDQFAFGTATTMKLFCNILDNIHLIYERFKEGFHTETYVGHNISINTLDLILTDTTYYLNPKRL